MIIALGGDEEMDEKRKLFLLGHSHVDVVWLWPLEETKQVVKELFRNMLKLMDKYPYYTFAQSTALYYKWIEEEEPLLFEKIKEYVSRGQWEIVGGSWVECDCLMLSGESLVRQFLYGKRYFKEKFNVDVKVAWFPDSFGFPATLPQILSGCGIKYFVTQKLNWNDTVLYPYNIFWWKGPNGSRVLAYQTVGGYWGDPRDLDRIKLYFKLLNVRQRIKDLLLIYGIGDHGGGPTEDMVKSTKELAKKFEKEVEVIHTTSLNYLKYIEDKYGDTLPTLNGELYLQFHRGVYTSQVKIKELVKKSEYLLEILEKLLTLKFMLTGQPYNHDEVRSLWYKLLASQFHDILSGSLSKTPYWEFRRILEELVNEIDKRIKNTIRELIELSSSTQPPNEEPVITVFNPNPRNRTITIEMPGDNSKKRKLIKLEVPGLCLQVISLRKALEESKNNKCNDLRLSETDRHIIIENNVIKVTIDKSTGRIVSLYNKQLGQEFLGDKGLRFEIYDDTPTLGRMTMGTIEKFADYFFDCWEVYAFQNINGVKYTELIKPEKIEVVENNSLRITVMMVYSYIDEQGNEALIKHYVKLCPNTSWIEGEIEVTWKCIHKMLKLCLDLNYWSEYITVGQPYGHVVRRNPASPYSTLFDRSMWEAYYNEWIDYSNGEKGIALICSNRFGYDFMGRTLRLTLLRGPRFPPDYGHEVSRAPELLESQEPVEQEDHHIKYYIYLHEGDWKKGKVPIIAEDLIKEPYIFLTKSKNSNIKIKLFKIVPEDLSIPAIKLHEDEDGIILRIVNYYDDDVNARIIIDIGGKGIKRAVETNLLEEELRGLNSRINEVELQVGGCSIKTLKMKCI